MLVNLADEDVILIGKPQLFLLSMEDQETFIPGVTILLGEYTQKTETSIDSRDLRILRILAHEKTCTFKWLRFTLQLQEAGIGH